MIPRRLWRRVAAAHDWIAEQWHGVFLKAPTIAEGEKALREKRRHRDAAERCRARAEA